MIDCVEGGGQIKQCQTEAKHKARPNYRLAALIKRTESSFLTDPNIYSTHIDNQRVLHCKRLCLFVSFDEFRRLSIIPTRVTGRHAATLTCLLESLSTCLTGQETTEILESGARRSQLVLV